MKNIILTRFLFGLSILFFLSDTPITAQPEFTHKVDQPVLTQGSAGEFDQGGVWFPAVIKDGDTLRMWYTGFNQSAWKSGPKGKIGYAWSLDGINWTKDDTNPVLSAGLDWEAGIVMTCAVIKEGSIFKMWYGASGYAPSAIGYASSPDGINWTKHNEPVLTTGPHDWDSSVIAPHTVIKEGDIYKMWYWAGTGWSGTPTVQFGMAVSVNGIDWTKYNDSSTAIHPFKYSDPVLNPGPEGAWDDGKLLAPMVLTAGSGYEMWYNSTSKTPGDPYYIGYAASSDGISWNKSSANPVFDAFPAWGSWFGGGSILKINDQYHFWFSCFHTTAKGCPQIGYAVSGEGK